MELKELIQLWQVTSSLHSFNPPVNQKDLQQAEAKLAFHLPPPLRELYLYSNGMSLFRGSLSIYPLLSTNGKDGLDSVTTQCREWFQIPPDVLVFGNNGSDEHYGFWTSRPPIVTFSCPIVEIGELYVDPACMAVVATDLLPFLFGETAFFSLVSELGGDVLDIIDLPEELRVDRSQVNNKHFAKIRKWADPMLPDPDPEPYTKGLNTNQIQKLFGF